VKQLVRILSWLPVLPAVSTLIPIPRRFIFKKAETPGRSQGYLMQLLLVDSLKGMATLFAPFLALISGLGALLALAIRDVPAVVSGLTAATLLVRHLRRVVAPHDGFQRAFGPDWRSRIRPELYSRLSIHRWRWQTPKPSQVPREQNLPFGIHVETGDPLLCDLWQPPITVSPTGLGIIYLHGSGWHFLDKDFGTRHFFALLASQGHVIMDVAYTLAPRADMQGMLNDVRRSVVWLKEQGPTFGVDPERVVLMGGSSGGHLALLAAYATHYPELLVSDVKSDTTIHAVVSFYGVTDLVALHNQLVHVYGENKSSRPLPTQRLENLLRQTGAIPSYGKLIPIQEAVSGAMGGTPEELPEQYRLFSPLTHVGPHCPPTLILQGGGDMGVIPKYHGRPLYQALVKASVPAVYVEYPSAEHAFDLILPRWNPSAQAATYDVERFLALMV
jgi:acetyl esterase/lipase